MAPRALGVGALAVLLTLLSPLEGRAQGRLQVGTTRLEIRPGGTAASLILRNTGTAPVAAQVRVYRWSQPDGVDQLDATGDMVVSPAIVEVPAGSDQLVRVIRVGPPAANRDDTFRVVVDEIPAAEDDPAATGVQMRMRYLLPLFVRAAGATPAELTCAVDAAGERITCENAGGRTAQLGDARLVGEDGRAVELGSGMAGYLLPGARKSWPLPPGPGDVFALALRVEARLDGQPAILSVARER